MGKKQKGGKAEKSIKDLTLKPAEAKAVRGGQLSARSVKPGATPNWDLKAQKGS